MNSYLHRLEELLTNEEFVSSCDKNFVYYSAMQRTDDDMKSLKIKPEERNEALSLIFDACAEYLDLLDLPNHDVKNPNTMWLTRLEDHMKNPQIIRSYRLYRNRIEEDFGLSKIIEMVQIAKEKTKNVFYLNNNKKK